MRSLRNPGLLVQSGRPPLVAKNATNGAPSTNGAPTVSSSHEESLYLLAPRQPGRQYFLSTIRKGCFGKLVLPALQSRDRSRTQICRGVYVRANGRHPTAAKVIGAAHLFLPAVLRLPGHGTSTRRRAEPCGLEHDPRPGGRRPCIEPGGLGKPARRGRSAAFQRTGEHPSPRRRRWLLRVLSRSSPGGESSQLRLGGRDARPTAGEAPALQCPRRRAWEASRLS